MEVVGDTRHFERSLARSSKTAQSFSATVTRSGRSVATQLAAVAGATVGVAAVFEGLRKSVNVASDLAEATSKTTVVFEESAQEIFEWSRTSAKALGLARDQALDTASSLGALLTPIGLTGDEAARQSKALTQLGADLASFYNTSVQDALTAVRAGLIGEAEPLRRYGVLLSEARVKQEAMAATGKKVADELTNQDKALARIRIIFQDTGKAQGDFARTSDGLANQQRILTANIRDLQAGIGELLIPVVTDITKRTNEWLGETRNQERVLRDVKTAAQLTADAFKVMADSVLISAAAFRELREARGSGRDLLGPFGFLLDTLPQSIRGQIERGKTLAEAFGLTDPKVPGIQGPQGPAAAIAEAVRGLRGGRPVGLLGPTTEDAFKRAGEEAGKKTAEGFRIGLASGGFGGFSGIGLRGGGARNPLLAGLPLPAGRFDTGRRNVLGALTQRAQFRALGLTGTGEDLAPTREALQARLGEIQKALKGTILDTSPNRNLIARVRKVLGLQFGALTRETKLAVDRLLGAFDELKPKAGTDGFRKAGTQRLVDLLRESGAVTDARAVRQVLAQIGRGGTVPGGRSAAFSQAGATVVNIGTLVSHAPDYARLENEIARRAKARPQTRRGALN